MKTLDDLPVELHRLILDSLDLTSIQTCLLVSRKWNKEIQTLAYKRVHVRSIRELEHLMSDQDRLATSGRKVRDICLRIEPKMNIRQLCELPSVFPNVKCMSLFYSTYVDLNGEPRVKSLVEKWTKLTSFNELGCNYPPLLQHFLETPNANNLTSIKLHLHAVNTTFGNTVPDAYLAAKQVIPLLKNCPALQHLTLARTHLKADDIEELHQHVPRLKSLHLKDIVHLQRRTGDPAPKHKSITHPAIRIKEFYLSTSIEGTGIPEERTHKDWLDYIAEKYPNVETLTFNAKTRVSNAHKRQQTHVQQLVKMARNCRHLKRLHITFVGGFSEQLAAALAKSNIQLEAANVHGSTDSTREQLERLGKLNKDIKTLQILTFLRKKTEEPTPDPYALPNAIQIFQNLQEVTVTKGYDFSYHHSARSFDYCSYKLLHLLLKHSKNLASLSIDVGAVVRAFDEDMHTLSVAENLKKLAICEMEYGLAETNYLNNVILPNCPHLTDLTIKIGYCLEQMFERNRTTHPDVTYIKLHHQHHLKTMSIAHSGAAILLRVLPDESIETTPKRWFRELGYEDKDYDKKIDKGRYTVLYLQPECLDAFLRKDLCDPYNYTL